MEPTQITPCNKSPTSESAWGTQNRFSQLRNARVAVSEEEVMDMSINQLVDLGRDINLDISQSCSKEEYQKQIALRLEWLEK